MHNRSGFLFFFDGRGGPPHQGSRYLLGNSGGGLVQNMGIALCCSNLSMAQHLTDKSY